MPQLLPLRYHLHTPEEGLHKTLHNVKTGWVSCGQQDERELVYTVNTGFTEHLLR